VEIARHGRETLRAVREGRAKYGNIDDLINRLKSGMTGGRRKDYGETLLKIKREMARPNPETFLINHWEAEIKAFQKSIENARKRLNPNPFSKIASGKGRQ